MGPSSAARAQAPGLMRASAIIARNRPTGESGYEGVEEEPAAGGREVLGMVSLPCFPFAAQNSAAQQCKGCPKGPLDSEPTPNYAG
jgi:hypothetical protein